MKTIALLVLVSLFSTSIYHKYGPNANFKSPKSGSNQVQLYQFYFIVNDSKVAKFSGIKDFKNITDAEADLANMTKNMTGYTKRVSGPFTGTNVARENMDDAKAQWKASGYTIGAL